MEVNTGILVVEVLITLVKHKDTTGHNNFDPTSLHSGDCKLITLGENEIGVLAYG